MWEKDPDIGLAKLADRALRTASTSTSVPRILAVTQQ